MTDNSEKSAKPGNKSGAGKDKSDWSSTAAIAGAAIGSAALAAALLFASRRKDKSTLVAAHPEEAPETD